MIDDPADQDPRPAHPEPVTVTPDALSPAALRGLVESFVLREGTDYGLREVELEEKVRNVLRQLERGEARITFDPQTSSIDVQPVPPSDRRRRDRTRDD
jgi:uncharacterized protein YheU (UPF0270 family)